MFYDDKDDVFNSSLYSEGDIGDEYSETISNNSNLKTGIVIALYDIDNKGNISKTTPEYDVLIVEQKKNSSMEPVIYKNCIAIDSFGGVADFLEFTTYDFVKQ